MQGERSVRWRRLIEKQSTKSHVLIEDVIFGGLETPTPIIRINMKTDDYDTAN